MRFLRLPRHALPILLALTASAPAAGAYPLPIPPAHPIQTMEDYRGGLIRISDEVLQVESIQWVISDRGVREIRAFVGYTDAGTLVQWNEPDLSGRPVSDPSGFTDFLLWADAPDQPLPALHVSSMSFCTDAAGNVVVETMHAVNLFSGEPLDYVRAPQATCSGTLTHGCVDRNNYCGGDAYCGEYPTCRCTLNPNKNCDAFERTTCTGTCSCPQDQCAQTGVGICRCVGPTSARADSWGRLKVRYR